MQRKLIVPEGINAPPEIADAVHYICHKIYTSRWRRNRDENGYRTNFTNLKAAYLRNVVGSSYKPAIEWLIANKWVETDNRYVTGIKSRGYRLSKSKLIETAVSADLSSRIRRQSRKDRKCDEKQHKYLRGWLRRIEIDVEAAHHIIDGLHASVGGVTDYEYHQILKDDVSVINAKQFDDVVVCPFGRFHTPITNLSRHLRCCLSFGGKSLVNIDVANSQPLILCALIAKELKGVDLIPSPPPLPYDVRKQETSDVRCCQTENCEVYDLYQDFRKYRELCESGYFYQFMMSKSGHTDKSKFKDAFFGQVLYATGQKEDYKLCRIFKENFPTVWNIVLTIRRREPKLLPREMQRMESRLMIDGVAKELMENHPNIPVATIHDSILTTPENAGIIEESIRRHFGGLGLKPTIRRETYERPEQKKAQEEEVVSERPQSIDSDMVSKPISRPEVVRDARYLLPRIHPAGITEGLNYAGAG